MWFGVCMKGSSEHPEVLKKSTYVYRHEFARSLLTILSSLAEKLPDKALCKLCRVVIAWNFMWPRLSAFNQSIEGCVFKQCQPKHSYN